MADSSKPAVASPRTLIWGALLAGAVLTSLLLATLSACAQYRGVEPGGPGWPPPSTGPGEPYEPSPDYDHLMQLHVSPSGADDASGTVDDPLRSIGEALARAHANRSEGSGTRINLGPGVYRESLIGSYSSTGGPLIVIESVLPHAAIVSGSDVWNGWTCGGGGICTHEWPYRWGASPNPWSSVDIGELARRREMIVVNGLNLDQHLAGEALTPGSFSVDEGAGTVAMRPPAGVVLAEALVEVAVRSTLMRLQGMSDFVIKGVVFTHAATPFRASAIEVVDQHRVLLEGVAIVLNGQTGVWFKGTQFTVRDTVMNHNGSSGFSALRVADVLFEDTETSHNNWRGVRGGYTGWEVGQKLVSAHRTILRRHVAEGNATRGLWLDTDASDVLIEQSRLCDNLTNGLFVEASQGPIVVRDSQFCGNRESGLLTSATHRITLQGNQFDGNDRSAVHISGDFDRTSTDWETGETHVLNNEDWTWTGNTMTAPHEVLIVSTTHPSHRWTDLMASADFDRNVYAGSPATVFQVPDGRRLSFSEWQTETGQDENSVFDPDHP
jgi:mannuronan 5-epimerase